jgi:hypothetical protein
MREQNQLPPGVGIADEAVRLDQLALARGGRRDLQRG